MTMLNVIELIVASMPLLHLGASVVHFRRVARRFIGICVCLPPYFCRR